jgi:predicted nucleotidyltransferase
MMPKRKSERPVAEVPRYALTRTEAAASLGMGVDTFDERVRPLIRTIHVGQLLFFLPDDLMKWAERNADYMIEP